MKFFVLLMCTFFIFCSILAQNIGAKSKNIVPIYFTPLGTQRLTESFPQDFNTIDLKLVEIAKEVLIRDPRNEKARLLVSFNLFLTQRFEDLPEVFFPLFYTDRANAKKYAEILALFSNESVVFDLVEKSIDADDYWVSSYMAVLVNKDYISLAQLENLAIKFPASRYIYYSSLMQRGQISAAYSVFKNISPSQYYTVGNKLYNPTFLKNREQTPFNWWMDSGSVSFTNPSGIKIKINNRKNQFLLKQIFPLGEGLFDYAYDIDMRRPIGASKLLWSIKCLPGGNVLSSGEFQAGQKTVRFSYDESDSQCNFATLLIEKSSSTSDKLYIGNLKEVSIKEYVPNE